MACHQRVNATMPNTQLQDQITSDIRNLASGDLATGATKLFATMGYESTRLAPDTDDDSPDAFLKRLEANVTDTQSEREFRREVSSVKLLFQVTDTEIQSAGSAQGGMFENVAGKVDNNAIQSFFFAVAELKRKSYPRGVYARVAREINKRLPIATVVLMRNANQDVSLAFVDRRPHKRNPNRAVLGNVALLREIETRNLHRAHLDILSELNLDGRLEWMANNGQSNDFAGLLAAWLDVLNTEELNKRFYRGLFKWFNRVIDEAKFPADEAKKQAPEEHVIRLISRMLFVWFIRENGLVPDELFSERVIGDIIAKYDSDDGDSYYRVILQNLFFATLNSPIKDRGFRDPFGRNGRANDHHRVFNKYRYEDEVTSERKGDLLELFKRTPFINGGLFDCLDSDEPTSAGGYRIDCFSDWHKHKAKLSIPNRLFFDESGLYQLFRRFKFTVEENTPAEREVALDPELLGNVFENLLAAFNPETSQDARKLTGSFYTPRPVVEYMVDHALVEALSRMCRTTDDDQEWWSDRLHYLFDYNDAGNLFEDEEKVRLVDAISDIKVLDPAVGSGAYPMAVLLKLTQALRRIDPDSRLWIDRQIRLAGEKIDADPRFGSAPERQVALQDVVNTVDTWRTKDYGRKLHILQNSIFGVDQQAAAIQTAKLRFFISLAIEQEVDLLADNFGVRPLPNLETRLIAANSVRKLPEGIQTTLQTARKNGIADLERELLTNRNRQFHARLYEEKRECARRDRELRHRLSIELRAIGLNEKSADMLAAWDPFDQTTSATWFEPEHMFGVMDGFNVVIGNPPYISVSNLPGELRQYLLDSYSACVRRTDIYIAFLQRSIEALASKHGFVCFIIPFGFTKQQYAEKMRRILVSKHNVKQIVDTSRLRIFENAAVFNCIVLVESQTKSSSTVIRVCEQLSDFADESYAVAEIESARFLALKDSRYDTEPDLERSLLIADVMRQDSVELRKLCYVGYGARLNHRDSRVNKIYKSAYIKSRAREGLVPMHEGRDVQRYSCTRSGWLDYQPEEHYNPMFPELFESPSIVTTAIPGPRLRFAFNEGVMYNTQTVINIVRQDRLEGVSLATVDKATAGLDAGFTETFDELYLLAVLNSKAIEWYFRRLLSEDLHLLPNDVKQLPIPVASENDRRQLVELVQKIDSTPVDPNLDREIDDLVFRLYGLSSDDVEFIKKAS